MIADVIPLRKKELNLILIAEATAATESAFWSFTIVDVVTAFLGAAAVWFAWGGLTTWRKQLKGTTEYEVARRLLHSTLKVRDNIKHARNPAIFGGELHNALSEFKIEGDSLTASQYDKNRAVYGRRMEYVDASVTELTTALTEAEVLWGIDVHKAFDPLFKSVNDLRRAVILFIRWSMPDRQVSAEKIKEVESIIYDAMEGEADDDYANELIRAVDKIRDYCKLKLK